MFDWRGQSVKHDRHLHGDNKFLFGSEPTSIDAGVYGFLANIYFYKIDTPLRKFVASHPNLIRHCDAVHAAVIKN
jgi:glutathione S-transferase